MRLAFFIGCLLLSATLQAIEVFKCTGPSGQVSFSQHPCPANTRMQVQDVKPINTIAPQAADPEDVRYLKDSRKTAAKERSKRERATAKVKKPKKTAKAKDTTEHASQQPMFKKPKPIKSRSRTPKSPKPKKEQ